MPNSLSTKDVPAQLAVPVTLLTRYLFFLSRRPVSASNTRFLNQRLRSVRSLTAFLESTERPDLEQIANRVNRLNPRNMYRLIPKLVRQLEAYARKSVPGHFVRSLRAPAADFFADDAHVAVVFGPGIGIGDEIMCFGIPEWFRKIRPNGRMTVMSAYNDLWSGHSNLSSVEPYADMHELVCALRMPASPFDVVFLIDFESPGIGPAVCREPFRQRFVEMSIASHSVIAIDKRTHRYHEIPGSNNLHGNFYDGVSRMMNWLLPQESEPFCTTRSPAPVSTHEDELSILVSPFTSKQDPSLRYWTRLLTQLISDGLRVKVRIRVDTGATADSESFAMELVRAARWNVPSNVICELNKGRSSGGRVPLSEMLDCAEKADIVLTTDSYLAHAAARFGTLTLVIAPPGLENWRVPVPTNYYFTRTPRVDSLAACMRFLIAEFASPAKEQAQYSPRELPECRELRRTTERVESQINGPSCEDQEQLLQLWTRFRDALSQVVGGFRDWPPHLAPLLGDLDYEQLCLDYCLPVPVASSNADPEVLRHLMDQFAHWKNSNLRKYLIGLPSASDGGAG